MNPVSLIGILLLISLNLCNGAVYQGQVVYTQTDPSKPPKLTCRFTWEDNTYTIQRAQVMHIAIGDPVNDCLECGPCSGSGLTCVQKFTLCPQPSP